MEPRPPSNHIDLRMLLRRDYIRSYSRLRYGLVRRCELETGRLGMQREGVSLSPCEGPGVSPPEIF